MEWMGTETSECGLVETRSWTRREPIKWLDEWLVEGLDESFDE